MSRISFSRKPVMLLAFALAMVISIAAVRPASAASVDYSTTGAFTSSGTDTSTENGDTVTYANLTSTGNGGGIISLGEYSFSGLNDATFSDTFTLTITQFSPASGTGSLIGTLAGSLTISPDGPISTIEVTFSSPSVTIKGVTYTIIDSPVPVPNGLSFGGRTTVEAVITEAVPVPAAVWSGMGLLGLIAVGKLRRFSALA